jgi:uncharacterized protein YbcI
MKDNLKGGGIMREAGVMDGNVVRVEDPPEHRGQLLLDISNAVVKVHKDFHGKGPTKARSHVSQNLITVVLEGGFTRSEQTLHAHGHHREVAQSRQAMRQAMESELCRVVESVTGRSVRSYMSAIDPAMGLQVDVFVLHAEGSGPASNGHVESGRLNGQRIHL